MDKTLLLDNCRIEGTDLKEFKKIVTEIDALTEIKTINLGNFSVLSYCGESQKTIPDEHNIPVQHDIYNFVLNSKETDYETFKIKKNAVFKKNMDEILGSALMEEVKQNKTCFMDANNKIYLISQFAISSLLQKINVGNRKMLKHSPQRDLFLAYAMQDAGCYNFVIREIGKGRKKIFGVFSEKYVYISQTEILKILDYIKTIRPDMICHSWMVRGNLTEVYVKFPEDAFGDFVPGIRIATSDTGSYSFTIENTLTIGKSVSIIPNNYEIRHIGDVDCFKEAKMITNKLLIEASDYSDYIDALKSKPLNKNGNTLEINQNAFIELWEDICIDTNMKKLIGQKRLTEYRENIKANYNWNKDYTYEDVFKEYLNIPKFIGQESVNVISLAQISRACGSALFLKRLVA